MHRIPIPARGFSLVELLVGMVAGLVVVAGTVGLVTAVLASNSQTIKAARLNQDLNAMMAIMVSDLRRAGYNAGSNTPFQYAATTSSLNVSGSCLSYIYEHGVDLQNYAFRRDGNFIRAHAETLTGLNDTTNKKVCATWTTSGDGAPLNDTNEIEITDFTVTDSSQCLDENAAIVACSATTAVVRVRQIGLVLQGRLTDDPAVTASVEEIVRLRNNESL